MLFGNKYIKECDNLPGIRCQSVGEINPLDQNWGSLTWIQFGLNIIKLFKLKYLHPTMFLVANISRNVITMLVFDVNVSVKSTPRSK